MDGNRRLGWIAIAIGSLALVVSLLSLGRTARFEGYAHGWQDRSGYDQAQPGRPGDGFGRENDSRGQMPFGDQRDGFAGRGEFGRHHSRFGLLLLPFMLLGGLVKLALFAGVFLLVLRLLGRGRRGGPGGRFGRRGSGERGWPHDTQPTPAGPTAQHRPGPESYTGETTNL